MATDIGSIRFTIEADSSDLNSAQGDLRRFQNETGKAAKSTNSLAKSNSQLGRSTKRVIPDLRQTSMQLSQVAQQASVTGNFMQALAIQLPDLALGLGPVGILLGAVAGGLLSYVVAANDASEETDTLIDRIGDLELAFEDLTSAQRASLLLERESRVADLQQQYSDLSRQLRIAQSDLNAYNRSLVESRFQGQFTTEQGDEFRRNVVLLQGELDTLNSEIEKTTDRYDELAFGFEDGTEAARKQQDAIQDLISSLRVQADTIGLTARETALYEAARLNATDADIKSINASFDRIEAYKREQEELKNLRELTKITAADDPLLGQVAAQDRGQQIIDQLRREAEATKRGLDERFAIEEEFNERVMSLRDGLRTGVIENEEELNDLIVRARTERNEQLADVERRSLELLTQSQEQALGALGSAFGNFSEIARQGGEDSFSEYKAFASAEAAIAASLAAIRALAEGGPFLGPILAGSIAALAAVQIANIQSQEYQGARVHGGQVQGGATYLVGERGPELFTPGATGQISSNKSLQGGGDVTVNVMNAPEGTRTEERTDSEGNRFVDVFIADMARGGPMSRSIQTTFATRRQGR